MTREEIDAILAATVPATRSGQRDRLLFPFNHQERTYDADMS